MLLVVTFFATDSWSEFGALLDLDFKAMLCIKLVTILLKSV